MATRKKTRTPKKSRKKAPVKKKRGAGKKASAKKRKPAPKKKARVVKKKPARKKAPAQKARPTAKPAAPAAVTKKTRVQIKTVDQRTIQPATALEETARRKFRVEKPIRKPSASRALSQNTLWDELIFVIVSDAGPRGITIENICKKALSIKHSKAEIMEKNIAPESNFHNSTISNIEAVRRYLDDNIYRTIYGYRDITKK